MLIQNIHGNCLIIPKKMTKIVTPVQAASTSVLQFNNSTVQQFNNSTIQQFNNSTNQLINKSTNQQFSNSTILINKSSINIYNSTIQLINKSNQHAIIMNRKHLLNNFQNLKFRQIKKSTNEKTNKLMSWSKKYKNIRHKVTTTNIQFPIRQIKT